jgi:hypothetical protein
MSDVMVQIEELVLVGFDRDERDMAVTALRDELVALLGEVPARRRGLPQASLEYRLGRERGPEAVGRAAARSIANMVGVRG